jgi:hypothetical protein
MQLLHHAQNPTSRFNTYLVWPRVNILVIDMSPLILKGTLSNILWPSIMTCH